jgi:predicted outer membrane repeat protein
VTGATGPTGAAGAAPCVVEDATAGTLYATFQAAVATAGSGDTLNVQGTCEGDTEITKNLTIQGQGAGATLNGEGQSGSVLTIESEVSISGLTITGGNADVGAGIYISNGTLTLINSTVRDNTAGFGGGIYSESASSLTLKGSTVSGNAAGVLGGGIVLLQNTETHIEAKSSVTGNSAGDGGGIFKFGGTLTIENANEVSGNTPENGY